MSHADRQIRAEIYDDFRDYFKHKIAKGQNENAILTDFSDLPAPGVYQFTIPLKHMETDDKGNVHQLVKAFKEGAYMESKVNIYDEGQTYRVVIPWKTESNNSHKKSHKKSKRRSSSYEKPSQTRLVVLGFAFMTLLSVSIATTSLADWKLVYGGFF